MDSTSSNIEDMFQLESSISSSFKISNPTNIDDLYVNIRKRTVSTITITKLNLTTEESQTININEYKNYETRYSFPAINSHFLPLATLSLPVSLNTALTSTASWVNNQTIFVNRLLTLTSFFLSKNYIKNSFFDDNVSLEYVGNNITFSFNVINIYFFIDS